MTQFTALVAAVLMAAATASAAEDANWSVSAQATSLTQYHPAFHSSVRGPNSLDPGNRGNTTNDATLFVGHRPWAGGEIWLNGKLDQGFGLSNNPPVHLSQPSFDAVRIEAGEGETTIHVRLHYLLGHVPSS